MNRKTKHNFDIKASAVAMTLAIAAGMSSAALQASADTNDVVAAELAVRTLPETARKSSIDAVFAEMEAADRECGEAWRRCKTREELDAHARAVRENFVRAVGGFPETRCPLNARTVAVVQRDGYKIEKVLFESWPNIHVTANLFLPDAPAFKPPYPAILLPCGHSNNGKGSETYQRGAVLAAKSGMACLIYDPYDQGERSQGKSSNVNAHNRIGALAALLGGGMARFRMWDGMRALDYLETRPEVDASRMGVMGNSGGGTMSSLLMAVEPRLKAACPSCYISTYAASVASVAPGDAEQNTFGQFPAGVNNASFALMQFPMPIRFMFCHSDFFPFKGSLETFGLVREVAAKFGLEDHYDMTDVDGKHGWKESTRTSSVEWMRRWLCGDRDAFKHDLEGYRALDKAFDPKAVDMGNGNGGELVCPGGKVLNLPGERTVYDLMREDYASAVAARKAPVAPETVRRLAGIVDPGGEKVVRKELSRKRTADGVEVVRFSYTWPNGVVLPVVMFVPERCVEGGANRNGGPLLVIGDGGAGERADAVRKALGDGRAVAVADLIGTGEVNGVRRRFYRAPENEEEIAVLLYALGKSLVGVQAGEILEIAQDMKAKFGAPVEVFAFGRVCIAAAHARFVRSDLVSGATLSGPPPSWAESLQEASRVPFANIVNGALRHYDWTDLLPLAAGAQPAFGKIKIRADYPGANVKVLGIDEKKGVVNVMPDFRDTMGKWFRFDFVLTGAAGRTLHFQFPDDNYNYLSTLGPAISSDKGATWRWLNADGTRHEPANAFDYTFATDENETRFAVSIPYQQSDWEKFTAKWKGRDDVRFDVLCKSQSGRRDTELLRIPCRGGAKWLFAFTARHHASETTGNAVMEGAIEEALSGSVEGEWLRENADCVFIPFMDKDGVEEGDQGKNRRPHDHNRDYIEGRYTSVRALRELLVNESKGKQIVFFDLHAPGVRSTAKSKVHDYVFTFDSFMTEKCARMNAFRQHWVEAQKGGALAYDGKRDSLKGAKGRKEYEANKKKGLMTSRQWVQDLPNCWMSICGEFGYSRCSGIFSLEAGRELGRNMLKAGVRTILADGAAK